MNDTIKGYIYATLALISGATLYMLSKYITNVFDQVSTQNMAFWGFLGASIISTPYFIRNNKSRKLIKKNASENFYLIIGISIISSIAVALYWYIVNEINVGVVALLSQSNVLFSLILSMIFLGESINRTEKNYLVLVMFGFLLISTINSEMDLRFVFLILLTRFLYALQSFLVKKFGKNIDGFSVGFIRTWLMAFFLLIISSLTGGIALISYELFAYLTISIFFGAILCKSFFFEAHKYLEIGRLNIFMLFQAVLTLIGSVLLFGEPLSIQKVIGTIMIIGGLILFTREQIKTKEGKH